MSKDTGYFKVYNDIWDALIKHDFTGKEHKLVDIIMRQTWGYNKSEDRIALSQFVEKSGMLKPHVVRTLNQLKAKNVILVTKDGNKKGNLYCLNKKFSEWISLPRMVTVTKDGNKSLPRMVHTKDNTKDIKRDKSLLVQDRRNPEIDFILSEYKKQFGHEPTDKKPRFVAHNLRQLTKKMVKDIAPFHPTGLSYETVITKLFEWYCKKYDEEMRGESLEIVKRKGTRLYFEAAREKYIPNYKLANQNDQK